MDKTQISYLVFGGVIILALLFDLGLLSKKHQTVSIKNALFQTLFWVGLSLAFFAFLWWGKSGTLATKYITAYLMEWSLSIDNIFVFILIFTFFKVDENETARVLLIGILLAIVFRILFIAMGVGLIDRFHWILYIFGGFLLFTGVKLFFSSQEEEYNPSDTKMYKWMTKILNITDKKADGKLWIKQNNKTYFTNLAIVVLMLGGTDIVFALDSIPTVVSLVRESPNVPFTADEILVIYSSNIFAVLGLRSLFFLLRGAVDKFAYLQQGIAVVLAFIGAKMLVEFFNIHIPIGISLGVVVGCLVVSIIYSVYSAKKKSVA